MYISSTISVSRKDNLNCIEIAKFLSKAGVITSITSNVSTLPHIEYGCRLTQTIESKNELENIWELLKKQYNFKCAHLKIEGVYDGCILNYLRPSICKQK